MIIPLGNLDPYFTLNVSKTFLSISTKPLLSLILDFLKNHPEELVETLYWREEESTWVWRGWYFTEDQVVLILFCLYTYLKHLWKITYSMHILKFTSKIFTLNLNGYTTCNFRYHVYVILFTIKQVHHSFICILNIVAICCHHLLNRYRNKLSFYRYFASFLFLKLVFSFHFSTEYYPNVIFLCLKVFYWLLS